MKQARATFNQSKIAELIGKRQLTSDEITSPAVYHFMNNYIPSSIVNPQTFSKHKKKITPVYQKLPSKTKRIVNTRNPFSRLYAAWGDKLRLIKKEQERWDERYGDFWDRAEKPEFKIPEGYRNSFHAFLRYVTQEDGEQHLNR